MVTRPPKHRREADDDGGDPDDGPVDLGAAEHAWWAQRTTDQVWTPRAEPPPLDEAPTRDTLADHFGEDWRSSFDFDAPAADAPAPDHDPAPEPVPPVPAPSPDVDPYAVLGVAEAATWEEIVAAHRGLARAHHPDIVAQRPVSERLAAEDRIRIVNIAYGELRVRRGR